MSQLSKDDLKRLFENLDSNGDGVMSLDELNRLLEGVAGERLTSSELESIAGKGSGLNIDEFVSLYDSIVTISSSSTDDDIAKAFDVFDLNRDGFISSDELESVLERLGLFVGAGNKDCKSMIGAFDSNSDGKLDFDEFKDMMLITTTPSSSSSSSS